MLSKEEKRRLSELFHSLSGNIGTLQDLTISASANEDPIEATLNSVVDDLDRARSTLRAVLDEEVLTMTTMDLEDKIRKMAELKERSPFGFLSMRRPEAQEWMTILKEVSFEFTELMELAVKAGLIKVEFGEEVVVLATEVDEPGQHVFNIASVLYDDYRSAVKLVLDHEGIELVAPKVLPAPPKVMMKKKLQEAARRIIAQNEARRLK